VRERYYDRKKKSSSRDRYYDRKKKVLVICLAGAQSLLRPEKKSSSRDSYYDRKKKSSSRLSGGCAIVVMTGIKQKF
jgi:hypothetical protein